MFQLKHLKVAYDVITWLISLDPRGRETYEHEITRLQDGTIRLILRSNVIYVSQHDIRNKSYANLLPSTIQIDSCSWENYNFYDMFLARFGGIHKINAREFVNWLTEVVKTKVNIQGANIDVKHDIIKEEINAGSNHDIGFGPRISCDFSYVESYCIIKITKQNTDLRILADIFKQVCSAVNQSIMNKKLVEKKNENALKESTEKARRDKENYEREKAEKARRDKENYEREKAEKARRDKEKMLRDKAIKV